MNRKVFFTGLNVNVGLKSNNTISCIFTNNLEALVQIYLWLFLNIFLLMKMKKLLTIFILLIFLSCSDKSTNSIDDNNLILLKVGEKADTTQFFKDHFVLDNVVPVETTDNFLVGSGFKRFITYKNKLIILDRNAAVFVVDYASGKVDSYIKNVGRGPGESRKICDMCFDEKTETIILFNDFQQLLFYDLNGKFIKSESFKKLYETIIYDNGDVLFYNDGEGYSCYPYKIDKYNLQDKTLRIIGRNDRLDFNYRLFGNHMVKSKNIWFGTPADFELFKYENSKIESIYRLEPKTPLLTKEKMKLSQTDSRRFSDEISTIMYGIAAIRETSHYLVFRSSKVGFFVLNKETNEIFWENYVHETSLGLKLMNYFPHNGDDDRIMFVVDPIEWIHLRKDANMIGLSESLIEKIESFSIEEDSNPILVFYREK